MCVKSYASVVGVFQSRSVELMRPFSHADGSHKPHDTRPPTQVQRVSTQLPKGDVLWCDALCGVTFRVRLDRCRWTGAPIDQTGAPRWFRSARVVRRRPGALGTQVLVLPKASAKVLAVPRPQPQAGAPSCPFR